MRPRALIALAVVCAGVAAFRTCVSRPDSVLPAESGAFAPCAAESAIALRIDTTDGTWSASRGPGGDWLTGEAATSEIDPEAMRSLLTTLSAIEVRREVDDLGEERGAAGLDGSAPRVRILCDGAPEATWTVGAPVPGGAGRYAERGDGRVFLIDPSALEVVLAAPVRVTERRPAAGLDPDAVDALTVSTGEGATIRLTRSRGAWRMQEPVRDRADDAAVSATLRALASLVVDRVEPEAVSVLDAARIVEIVPERGSALRLAFGARGPAGRSRVGRIGATWSGTISAGTQAPWERSAWDFRSRRLIEVEPAAVRRVTVETSGAIFAIDPGGSDATPEGPSPAPPGESVREWIDRLCRLEVAGETRPDALADVDVTFRIDATRREAAVVVRLGKPDRDGLRPATTSTRPGFVFLVEDEAVGGPWTPERFRAGTAS